MGSLARRRARMAAGPTRGSPTGLPLTRPPMTRPPPTRPPPTNLPPTFGVGAVSGGGFNAAVASGIDVASVSVGCVAHVPATASPQHRVVSWSRTVARDFELSLALERVQGGTLDVRAVPPPHGLDWRQRCKIIKDFCCALVYWHLQEPQLVHGVTEVPMPLLRPHGIGVSMSSC